MKSPATAIVCLLLAAINAGAALEPAASSASAREQFGAAAHQQQVGEGRAVSPNSAGAPLRAVLQDLEADATAEGLWLRSTDGGAGESGRFRVRAMTLGRDAGAVERLPAVGTARATTETAAYLRPGLIEEYSVSMDGVRQDFLVLTKPAGAGELSVSLEVTGARAEAAGYGVKLVLEGSRRDIAYHRLHVTDATGQLLSARIEVLDAGTLRVLVSDAAAVYPIRIDPTFCDADWISMGGLPGANNQIKAMATDDSGNLYVGGVFTVLGNVAANRIAKWNGSGWSALGEGMNFDVNALVVSGSLVYAGGGFTTAGGVAAKRIACWNGFAWSPLRGGFDGTVYALAVSGSTVYAGGFFSQADGISASNIARWGGGSWSALGAGTNAVVSALAASGANVYAGGSFTAAGGVPGTNRIAAWNGSAWSALDTGRNGNVRALVLDPGGNLYAGGDFTNTVAKWNGMVWSALGASGPNGSVNALAFAGGNLFVGGGFSNVNGVSAGNVARWNTGSSSWFALGGGVDNSVLAMASSGGNLYLGGTFAYAGGQDASRIAKWNTTTSTWSGFGSGLNNPLLALTASGTDLYVGGSFSHAGGIAANRIAKWNGSSWSALGAGLTGPVYAIAVAGNDIYAGGAFSQAGGAPANNIAKWSGATSAWSALNTGSNGTNGSVNALVWSGTGLYVGGSFSAAGSVAGTSRIARWSGTAWSALGTGFNNQVHALTMMGPDLVAGGDFTMVGATSVDRIAKWDGGAWSALSGGGFDGSVRALAVSGAALYAGGLFTHAGLPPANHVAKWDGAAWNALGSGTNSWVYALTASGADLYAGGLFTSAGGKSSSYIAKWDGSAAAWSPLGSGVDGQVNALAVSNDSLFAGGYFLTAGGKVSPYLARTSLVHYSDGSLDANFGSRGIITTDHELDDDSGESIALQADGRIIMAATFMDQFLVTRFLPDGSLDPGFGSGGRVATSFAFPVHCGALAIQPDGKIVIAGEASAAGARFVLARYTPEGILDPTFGTNGTATAVVGTNETEAHGLAIQSDGKILVVGYTNGLAGLGVYGDAVMLRLDRHGVLDPGFGGAGVVRLNFPDTSSRGAQVIALGNGKILLSAMAITETYTGFVVIRCLDTGAIDTSFGTDGIATTVSGNLSARPDMALQGDGKIVVTANARSFLDMDIAVVRLLEGGTMDPGFGSGGQVVIAAPLTAIGHRFGYGAKVLIQNDGRILTLGGWGTINLSLARLLSDGTLDPSFGMAGLGVTARFRISDAALQPDGKIVVCASRSTGLAYETDLLRYATGPNISIRGNNVLIASGDITPSPPDLTDFGSAALGEAVARTFNIANSGAEPLVLTGGPASRVTLSPADAPFTVTSQPAVASLPACTGATTFVVTFRPTLSEHVGFQTASVSIASNDDDENPYTFALRGCGLAPVFSDGRLDPTFDSDGKVNTAVTPGPAAEFCHAAAGQPDGMIVVAGSLASALPSDFLLARYRADGSLDPAFGSGGSVITPVGTGADVAYALAIQPDGKILVAGAAVSGGNEDFAVLRYLSNGTLDPDFGIGGMVTTDIGGLADRALAVALLDDGCIVVAGTSFNGSDDDFAVLRYLPNGALDTGFGSGGLRTNFTAGSDDEAHEVLVQPDGRIVLAGTSGGDFALARYDHYGVLDASFGSFGRVTTDLGSAADRGLSAVMLDDGRLLVAGDSNGHIALARYQINGAPDPGFGTAGKLLSHAGIAYDVALQPDGKFVAGGWYYDGANSNSDFLLARYLPNGAADSSFDGDGIVTTNLTTGFHNDVGQAVVVQCTGNIVVAGYSQNGSDSDLALASYAVAPAPEIAVRLIPSTPIIADGDNSPGFLDGTEWWAAGTGVSLGITYLIQNSGTGDLLLSPDLGNRVTVATTEGSPFTVSAQPSSSVIPPGGSLEFQIVFGPASAAHLGSHTATVSIASNDLDEAPYTFDIKVCFREYSDGSLDESFGTGGWVRTNLSSGFDIGAAVAVQSDGNIVVAGSANGYANDDFGLVRYRPDGSLDTTFGTGGIVTTAIGPESDLINAITFTKDDRILVAGQTNHGTGWSAVLACYQADGSLDPAFGEGGIIITDIATQAFAVAVQTDGRILLLGYQWSDSTKLDFKLIRYSADGTLDTSFNGTGVASADFGGESDIPTSLVIQPNGRIVAAGYSNSGLASQDLAMARYLENGTLDPSFGSGGKIQTDIDGRADYARAVLVADDALILAGCSGPDGAKDFVLARYHDDGSPDLGFGPAASGKIVTDFGLSDDVAQNAILQSDGKIVLVGTVWDGLSKTFALARYGQDGALDPAFNSTGWVKTAIASAVVGGLDVAELCDGSLAVAGFVDDGGGGDFALLRYATGSRNIAVIGNALEIADGDTLSQEADHTNFGGVCAVDGTLARVFTLANRGSGLLTLTGSPQVAIYGDHAADFSVTLQPDATVAGGTSTSFAIRFDPSATGVRAAFVSIASNDSDADPYTFAIQGTGLTSAEVFEAAMSSAGLSGGAAAPHATPYHDGVANLLKYACNMNLNAADSRVLARSGTAGLPRITLEGSGAARVLRYEFVRRIGCAALTYTPQKSASLANDAWLPLTYIPESPPQVTPIDSFWERVVHEEPADPATSPRLFGRVVVTLP